MDRNLRAFLAVARSGNLTSAADKIGLTQPALTKTVRRLEHDFGADLFERTSRGMVLTQVGERLLARAEAIEMHYRQAHEEIRAATLGAVAQFSIAAGAAYHMNIAPDLAKQLSTEFPATDFMLDFDVAGITLPKVVEGEIDLMLGAMHGVPPEGIETLRILDVTITAYCCRHNPLARVAAVPPSALRDRKWIIYKRDQLIADRLRTYCADHILPPPTIRMEVDILAASFRVVSGTEFLTLAPTSLEKVAAAAGLTRLTLERPIWKFASGAWFRKSSRELPIMLRALQLLPQLANGEGRTRHSLGL